MYISAAIPTRDRPEDLVKAVASILEQSCLPNELIIIDQSADMKARRLVTELCENRRPAGLDLIYIQDPAIAGLVPAKAVAVTRSRGDVVFFFEDDVILERHYIERMAEGFRTKPGMLGASGVIVEMPRRSRYYHGIFRLFHRGIFHDKRVNVHGNPSAWGQTLIQSSFLNGGISAYRREVFDKVKFDVRNDFFMLEDIDFSTRAARAFGEHRFFINTSARLSHTFSPINRARAGARFERKLREYVCFYKKHRDRNGALLNLLWLLVGLTIEALFVSVRIRDVSPLTGAMKGLRRGAQWRIQEI